MQKINKYKYILLAIFLIPAIGFGASTIVRNVGTITIVNSAPEFDVPLLSSLDLKSGAGKATFTRSDTANYSATFLDFEGLIKRVKTGEARFEGARRVENYVQTSENYSGFTLANSASLVSSTSTAPDGSSTAGQFALPTAGTQATASRVMVPTNSSAGSFDSSVWLKADIAGNINLHDSSSGVYSITIPVTTSWVRYSTGPQALTSSIWHSIYRTTGSSVTNIYVWHPQRENVTGQANQNPSEYVSVGVKPSAPYHGANVDGVKYFTTYNGNTVSSNVVTEATGASIPDATLHGYVSEGSRVNLTKQSEVFKTTWLGSDVTIVDDSVVSPSGTLTADTMMEATTTAEHQRYQSMAVSNATAYTSSMYVKYLNRQWVTLRFDDGTSLPTYFDVLNGVVGTVAASTTANIKSVGNSWYRISVTRTSIATTQFIVISTAVTDNGGTTFAGDITKGVYLWGGQTEAGAFASSYIPTVASTVTRGADVLAYTTLNNVIFDAPYSFYVEGKQDIVDTGGTQYNFLGSTNAYTFSLFKFSTATVSYYSQDPAKPESITVGAPYIATTSKYAGRYNGTNSKLFSSGLTSTATISSPTSGNATFNVGSRGNGNQLYGTVRNVKIWKQALTDAQLTSLTSTSTTQNFIQRTTITN